MSDNPIRKMDMEPVVESKSSWRDRRGKRVVARFSPPARKMLDDVAEAMKEDNLSHVMVAIWRDAESDFIDRYGGLDTLVRSCQSLLHRE